MHVLLVYRSAYPAIKGGVDTLLNNLIGVLLSEGHQISLFTPASWQVDTWQREQHDRVTVLRKRLRLLDDRDKPLRGFLAGLWELPQTLASLYQYCRRERVDVVHIFTLQRYHLYFRLLQRLGGPPYVVTGVGSDFFKFPISNPPLARQLAAILAGAAATTAVAPHLAEVLTSRLPAIPPPHVIANGINAATIFSNMADADEVPITLPDHYFVVVGDIEVNKSPDVVIRAWHLLASRLPHLHLVIIGINPVQPEDQKYYDSVVDLVRQGGCQERIHIVPVLERRYMLAVARGSMGLILASRSEGLPFVMLESGVLKLATVFTAVRPFTDFLVDGVHTLLFPPGDEAALANSVERIATDPFLAKKLADNLHGKVTTHMTDVSMTRHYLSVYREAISFSKR